MSDRSTSRASSRSTCGKMPLALLVALLVLVGWLNVQAQELSEQEKSDGFVSLFNGRDLTGWRFDESKSPPQQLPENWTVENSVIKLLGGGSPHLASAKEFRDFDLRLEWRGVRDKYNSGLFLRSGKKVSANQINLARGGEGAFIGGKIEGAKKVPELQKTPGEWNAWRVLVQGDKISLWCNGQLAWEATGLQPASGYLGLQAEGAALEFRNLRIREIKP